MDVISFGIANKAGKTEKNTRENILGLYVEGTFPHVKGRIDALETAIEAVNEKANKLIINDTINIMKANAKFNVVAKTAKYKHHNLMFEDFLDASGIDMAKSVGLLHQQAEGYVRSGTVGQGFTFVSTQELTDAVPEKAVLVVEESNNKRSIQVGGSGSYANAGSILKMGNTNLKATIGFKIKPASGSTGYILCNPRVTSDTGFSYIRYYPGGNIEYYYNNSTTSPYGQTIVTKNKLNFDQWNEVVFIADGVANTYTFVINGEAEVINFDFVAYNGTSVFDTIEIGRAYNYKYSNFYTTGTFLIDEIIIKNAPIAVNDIPSKLHQIDSTTLAYWRFEEGAGTTVVDASGKGKTLTLHKNPWSLDVPPLPSTTQGAYAISRDDGVTWEPITPETLFYFTAKSPPDKKMRLKAELPANVQLLSYGLTWF